MGQVIILTVSFLLISIPVSYVDIRTMKIPDTIILTGIIILLLEKIFIFNSPLIVLFRDMISGSLFLLGIRIFSRGNLGLGDVKYGSFLALYTGFPLWLLSFFIASVFALLFAAIGMSTGRLNKNIRIPFAPFLSAGAIASWGVKIYLYPGFWS